MDSRLDSGREEDEQDEYLAVIDVAGTPPSGIDGYTWADYAWRQHQLGCDVVAKRSLSDTYGGSDKSR